MKKYIFFIAGILLMRNLATAQEAPAMIVSGTVKTSQGDLLRYAFVQEKPGKTGVYTDSLGNFTLSIKNTSSLHITCLGYRDTLFKPAGNGSLTIILSPSVVITAANNRTAGDAGTTQLARRDMADRMMYNNPVNGFFNVSPNNEAAKFQATATGTGKVTSSPASGGTITPMFANTVAKAMGTTAPVNVSNNVIAQGDAISTFHEKDATQGSRFFFSKFTHGYVISAQDSLIQNPVFQLDYDKMGGNLLLTKDGVTIVSVDNDLVKTFTLFDALNQPYTFALAPMINKTHFVQVIADGNNYKIYKAVKTTFVKADYVSDGVASSGNNYDEYRDSFTYYLLNVKTGQVQQISLKKKALKQAFAGDEARADGYFKTNDGDIDDGYLAALGDYMNK
jgi:hypothetical protein